MTTTTSTTVFVRFIPPSVNIRRHHLENVFSQIGPIKKSSVILPHNNHNNKKKPLSFQDAEDTTTTATAAVAASSYGFVKYTTELDAQRAASKLNRSSLKVSDTETVKLKVERASRTTSASAAGSTTASSTAAGKKDGRDKEKSRRQHQHHHSSREDDQNHADDVDDDDHSLLKKKTNRLIVRNLSFYAKKNHIQKAFESQFGPLVDIHIPSVVVTKKSSTSSSTTDKTADVVTTTHRGFCFVTFQHAKHAQECLAHVEQQGKEVLIAKRPVSIARALNKTAFEQHQKQQHQKQHHPSGGTKQKSSSSSNVVIPEQEKPTAAQKEHDEDSRSESDSSSSSSSSSDSDSSDSDDEDDDDDGKDMKGSDDSESDGDDESATTSDDDDNDEKKSNNSGNNDRAAVEEKRTLFLRNLPFDATRHDLFELFFKFGYITGIYLVKDKETGIPKGTAFVSFRDAKGIQRALQAAASSESNVVVNNDGEQQEQLEQQQQQTDSMFVRQRDNDGGGGGGGGGGLMLKGRRIFVNLAVDKETAFSLTMDQKNNLSAADGGTSTAGEANSTKDRRNLYLKGEGRVDNQTDEDGNENNAWDELPESDKLKRQRAWSDKNSKLRSPLFFINPTRLSVRNLAKDVTEVELKKLCVEALQHGLEIKLVTAQDQIAHWKASGDVSTRDILKRVEALPDEEDVIPAFDAQNVRKFIPSVFIDCDFSTKNKKDKVSRGFGFVEFEHHAHALACLRELNNNTRYTQEYATGGKHAVITRMRQRKSSGSKKGKNRHNNNNNKTNGDGSNDNQVKLPRLIVEFAVENISKAKQQAEHRALQQANMIKQKREHRESTETSTKKEKKKSRGQRQREKKRRRKEAGEDNGDEGVHENATTKANERRARAANVSQQQQQHANRGETIKVKKVKPPKRRKVDKDEEEFQKLVASYKSSFAPDLSSNTTANDGNSRPKAKKRWFE